MKPPRVRPYPNETAFQQATVKRIREDYGGWARKVHGNAVTIGEPDIDACIRGRAVKLELKQPGEKPTKIQMVKLRLWADAGALSGWAVTMVEVDALLEHVDDTAWINPQLLPSPPTRKNLVPCEA